MALKALDKSLQELLHRINPVFPQQYTQPQTTAREADSFDLMLFRIEHFAYAPKLYLPDLITGLYYIKDKNDSSLNKVQDRMPRLTQAVRRAVQQTGLQVYLTDSETHKGKVGFSNLLGAVYELDDPSKKVQVEIPSFDYVLHEGLRPLSLVMYREDAIRALGYNTVERAKDGVIDGVKMRLDIMEAVKPYEQEIELSRLVEEKIREQEEKLKLNTVVATKPKPAKPKPKTKKKK